MDAVFAFIGSQQVDRMLGKNRPDMFGELLQAANNTGDLRSCPVRDLMWSSFWMLLGFFFMVAQDLNWLYL